MFIICHLALWVYSILLLRNGEFVELCGREEPHLFYIKIYVFIYAIVILGSMLLLLVLLIPVTALTVLSFKNKEEAADD